MARYRHWKNYAQAGQVAFVTTTALDFAHIFDTDEAKDRMVKRFYSDHAYYGAILHAYVVMSNHLHFLCRLPEGHDVAWFVQRIKSNSAKEILPRLNAGHHAQLATQSTLNRRLLWKAGYRSVPVWDEPMFWQKVEYIHQNPVRAELVTTPEEYRWSSAATFESGGWSDETGLAR